MSFVGPKSFPKGIVVVERSGWLVASCLGCLYPILVLLNLHKADFTQTKAESCFNRQDEGLYIR